MAQKLIDLDKAGILSEPVTVVMRGKKYKLPGDIPAPVFVRIQQVASAGEPDEVVAMSLVEELLALFQQYQPTMERLPLGLNEMVAVIGYVYSNLDADAEDAEVSDEDKAVVDPTPPTSAPRKRKSAS